MCQLLLSLGPPSSSACAACQAECRHDGPRLVRADDLRPVCERCGRRFAPELDALLRLADEAARVGKIGRHTVSPPYGALLELARAAESYANRTEGQRP